MVVETGPYQCRSYYSINDDDDIMMIASLLIIVTLIAQILQMITYFVNWFQLSRTLICEQNVMGNTYDSTDTNTIQAGGAKEQLSS